MSVEKKIDIIYLKSLKVWGTLESNTYGDIFTNSFEMVVVVYFIRIKTKHAAVEI